MQWAQTRHGSFWAGMYTAITRAFQGGRRTLHGISVLLQGVLGEPQLFNGVRFGTARVGRKRSAFAAERWAEKRMSCKTCFSTLSLCRGPSTVTHIPAGSGRAGSGGWRPRLLHAHPTQYPHSHIHGDNGVGAVPDLALFGTVDLWLGQMPPRRKGRRLIPLFITVGFCIIVKAHHNQTKHPIRMSEIVLKINPQKG